MPWWVWLVLATGVFIFLWKRRVQPYYHRRVSLEGVRQFVGEFIGSHRAGSIMLVEREGSAGLLQLDIHDVDDGETTVRIGLPEVDWSAAVFDEIATRLEQAGFDTRVRGGPGCNSVRRFLKASTTGTTDRVTARVTQGVDLVATALAWQNATFTVHFEL